MRTYNCNSPLTGTLTIQHVADGARVSAGETVAEVECMKTLWGITAPAAGVVRYKATLGQTVGDGELVAIIEGD